MLTYGLRGLAYFNICITGPGADLHSGIYGGTVYEPMTALIALMGKLVSQDAHILIPGAYDGILPPSEEELYVPEACCLPNDKLTFMRETGRCTASWTTRSRTSSQPQAGKSLFRTTRLRC